MKENYDTLKESKGIKEVLRRCAYSGLILMFCLVTVVVFIDSTALAGDKEASRIGPLSGSVTPSDRSLFEGFEGDFPPEGWTLTSINGHDFPETFFQGGIYDGWPLEGSYNMACHWDPDYVEQNNTMEFNHSIVAGEDNLNFWISGSLTWSANYDLTVEVDGIQLYSWQATYAGPDYTDEFVNIDLSAYLGTTVNILFRYAGVDGGAMYIDALMIDDGTGWAPPPPPPAPLNDTCDGAWDNGFVIMPGAFNYTGDNTWANPDYSLGSGSCTGYSVSGNDLVWVVCMDEGDVLEVTMDPSFDASLYLIDDCGDPFNSCVIGADDPETFIYTAEATTVYYLICSAYGSGVGPFILDGVLSGDGCTVATESQSWDSLKSLYR